ncbi:MAG TPA: 50S ribosomal protein L11 methyltransferase [Puia sp.]|nr:50S ribosomal protein L11 methyltransferase [Puia sp.]
MENYVQLSIDSDTYQQGILIALLAENGFEGFEENQKQLHAFIPERKFDANFVYKILSDMQLSYSTKTIEQKNWNEEWEKNFEPIMVDHFCGIRASFHQPIKNVDHEIIITPKMSFGTGHHPTTYLMIEAMKNIDFNNKTVLDFGTGTGILAILSEKIGAKKILAVDNDPWCIENSNENITANGCTRIVVEEKETVPDIQQGFDVILANINRNTILDQLPFLKQQLAAKGVLLVSGLLTEDLAAVQNILLNYNLDIISKSLKINWICLKLCVNKEGMAKKRTKNS